MIYIDRRKFREIMTNPKQVFDYYEVKNKKTSIFAAEKTGPVAQLDRAAAF